MYNLESRNIDLCFSVVFFKVFIRDLSYLMSVTPLEIVDQLQLWAILGIMLIRVNLGLKTFNIPEILYETCANITTPSSRHFIQFLVGFCMVSQNHPSRRNKSKGQVKLTVFCSSSRSGNFQPWSTLVLTEWSLTYVVISWTESMTLKGM